MGRVVPLGPSREWFADERGRSLRVTWHEEADVIVVSLWSLDGCIGTFHLHPADAPRLIGLLARAVEAWAREREASA